MQKEKSFLLKAFNTYKEYLQVLLKDNNAVTKIIDKGKTIVEELEELDKKDRKGLMVGQVQSGKTINFMSVIANSFLKEYKIIIIFSSIETKLHNQTVERIEEAFNIKKNINFIKLYDTNAKSNEISSSDFVRELKNYCDANLINIFISLKNPSNIDKINNIVTNKNFKHEKILIIDDEGDLASLSSSEKKGDHNTLKSLKKMYDNLENKLFLSVTATPQVHFMLSKSETLIPKRVFCIEPGKGYTGLDVFDNNKYYEIIKDNVLRSKDVLKQTIFEDAILYYLISWSIMMVDKEVDKETSHSNLLVHIDVKNEVHEEYSDTTKNILTNLKDEIESDLYSKEYNDFILKIQRIIDNYKLPNYLKDQNKKNDFIEKLKYSIKMNNVLIIDQKNKENKINTSLTSILIGSKKLERGVTLDNLIVTFFINRAKKSLTAIDTLLQRARWFGYRNNVLKYMKIFTTEQILEDFKQIRFINQAMWELLIQTEIDKADFELLDRGIFVLENSKLKPTNKVPISLDNTSNQSSGYLHILENDKYKYESIINDFSNNNQLVFNDKYRFLNLEFDSLTDFFNKYPDLKSIISINKESFKEIESSGCGVIVALMKNLEDNGPRKRKFKKLTNGYWYLAVPLSQGRSQDDAQYEYIGDHRWHDDIRLKNKIIIQIHSIIPYEKIGDDEKKLCDDPIYAWKLELPKEIQNKYKVFKAKYD